ncbi:MAG: hypothetical protein ACJAV2_004579 [Myxococcota bacterium]|jgi:hypothetical protein
MVLFILSAAAADYVFPTPALLEQVFKERGAPPRGPDGFSGCRSVRTVLSQTSTALHTEFGVEEDALTVHKQSVSVGYLLTRGLAIGSLVSSRPHSPRK